MTAKRSGTADQSDIFAKDPARQWPPPRPPLHATKDVPPMILWLVTFACILFPILVLLKL